VLQGDENSLALAGHGLDDLKHGRIDRIELGPARRHTGLFGDQLARGMPRSELKAIWKQITDPADRGGEGSGSGGAYQNAVREPASRAHGEGRSSAEAPALWLGSAAKTEAPAAERVSAARR